MNDYIFYIFGLTVFNVLFVMHTLIFKFINITIFIVFIINCLNLYFIVRFIMNPFESLNIFINQKQED